MVKQNESKTDRTIRIVIGMVGLIAGYWMFDGTAETIAYVIGVVGLGTGLLGFCGLYSILGFSTCPIKREQ
jgi:hypothetical protein